ncbi:bZIP transcription factor [Musa troglodytarum]|uniref:BZIP transcription factor n=1 Tax=Musa troglodytarum TaxID=320322 RepID=A0A9E7JNQ7_9LILI|nr:bZIP transcription factor [Musa troglodytarum]
MWPSLEQDNVHETNSSTDHRMVSSSSRASSSNSPLLISQTPRRTMEKVWKDITVTTLNRERPITPLEHHGYGRHHHHANSLPSFRDMMLQDFLAGPLSRPPTISPSAVEELPLPQPPPPTPPALPQTALSLNSGMELQHLRPDPKTHSDSTSSSHNASIISSVMAGPPSPTGLFTFRSRKQRLRENPTVGVDRRLQRLIKNRESAARSRARKQTCHLSFSPFQQKCLIFLYETLSTCLQAYTNELELEVSHLKEENAKLKKQYVEATLLVQGNIFVFRDQEHLPLASSSKLFHFLGSGITFQLYFC